MMRSLKSLVILLGLLQTASAAAQTPERRLDPAIRALLAPESRQRLQAIGSITRETPAGELPLAGQLAIRRDGAFARPMLGVFVRMRDGSALAQLRAAGAEIGSVNGEVVSASVPLDALEALSQAPGIASIEAARAIRIEHDSSMKAIHVDELREHTPTGWTGAAGQGAIVAIYDTGLDLQHPDFIDDAGKTRVLELWDQQTSGTPPTGYTYGNRCDRASIQARIDSNGSGGCTERDTNGHGTHVAGSAAGDGSAGAIDSLRFRWAGVAPAADLLIVNGGPAVFFENEIVDGLTWLRARGQAIGRPVVANLSLGGQSGPHDGSRLYERAIDNLSGPGFIVVISAGNNGVNRNTTPVVEGNLIHARGFATGTTTTEFTVEIPAYTPSASRCNGNFVTFSFWYEGADRLRLEVVRPSGTSASAVTGSSTTNNDSTGQILIDNGSGGVSPENGDYEATITISGCGTSGVPEAGTWKIRTTPTQPGTGMPFDMWMVQQVMGLTGIVIGRTGFDNRFVVGSPGNATRAVTVGAFVTKLCWKSPAAPNQVCYTQREPLGDIARFSSAGPRRDGVQKPEIAAPGLGITSALSRSAIVQSQRVVPDSVHWTLEGTSMAAPHVTGSIAVLMQVRPMLTPEEAKGILMGAAAQDSFTTRTYGVAPGGRPADWWGAGKLNVRDALLSLSDNTPAVLAVTSQSVAPSDETVGAKGTLLPLLKVQLEAKGFEAIDVLNLSFEVTGRDPSAKIVLVRDLDSDGDLEATDRVLGSVPVALNGAPVRVDIHPDSLRVPPFARTDVYLAVQLSGDAPNGATFSAKFLPEATQSVGAQSHAQNNLEATTPQSPSSTASTTILAEGQLLSFSENPVRHAQVIFNFAETPATASVYTVQGRRVADLCARMASGCLAGGGGGGSRLEWDLTNDDGARVAPSVYLVIFSVSGQVFREKLIVMTPGGSVPQNQE